MNFYGVVACCTLIIASLAYFFIKKFKDYSQQNKLFKLISWCVTKDSCLYRDNLRLEDYLCNAQIELKLSSEFCIDEDDLEFVKVILKKYQQDTMFNYFNNKHITGIPKSKHQIDGKTYFLSSLYDYLSQYQLNHEFMEYKIYSNLLEKKDFDKNIYHSTYELTEFGLAFYKIIHICLVSTVNNPYLVKSYIPIPQIENLKKSILSKSVSI
jgi:hypothetical protein